MAAIRSMAEWAASDKMLTEPVNKPAVSLADVRKVLLATDNHATLFFFKKDRIEHGSEKDVIKILDKPLCPKRLYSFY